MSWTVGDILPQGQAIFLFDTSSRPVLGRTPLLSQWVASVKRPGREADHSPSSSVEVKNGETIHPLLRTSSWLRA
jgi:hypothetical protein